MDVTVDVPNYVQVWKATPQSNDYLALSHVLTRGATLLKEPPTDLVKGVRAVHKSALEPATLSPVSIPQLRDTGINAWTSVDGVFFSFTEEAPLDRPYKLKLSETRSY